MPWADKVRDRDGPGTAAVGGSGGGRVGQIGIPRAVEPSDAEDDSDDLEEQEEESITGGIEPEPQSSDSPQNTQAHVAYPKSRRSYSQGTLCLGSKRTLC